MHTVVQHPLLQHRLAILRATKTDPKLFRELVHEMTRLIAFEALRDLPTVPVSVRTPMGDAAGVKIEGHMVVAPILRAGMGMLDPMLELLPYATAGVIGTKRNEETAEPIPYYAKVPPAKGDELAIAIDPMFATGGSAVDAVTQLKKLGYRKIIFLNLVSAPEGIANFEKHHPDVPVYTAAKDERLNSHYYIVPGLGDAGDRIFGTL
jgi:uracil phosphoribosyltransferase